jgi:hypothetical protein
VLLLLLLLLLEESRQRTEPHLRYPKGHVCATSSAVPLDVACLAQQWWPIRRALHARCLAQACLLSAAAPAA